MKLRLEIENSSRPGSRLMVTLDETVPAVRINEVLDSLKIIFSLTSAELNLKEVVVTVKTVTPIGKKEALRLTSAISMLSGAGKTTGANSSQYRELEQLQQDRLKFKKLSRRELQVANYIRDGLSTTKLSKKLNITAGTAKIHRKHIFRKLEIHKSAELISWLNKYFPGNNISANPD